MPVAAKKSSTHPDAEAVKEVMTPVAKRILDMK
jgi:hypothetical protein